jgi:hypothetical protein
VGRRGVNVEVLIAEAACDEVLKPWTEEDEEEEQES